MFPNEAIENFTLNTTDGTQVNFTDLAVGSSKTIMVWLAVLATRSNGDSAFMQRRGMFFTDAAGNISEFFGQRLTEEQETIKTSGALNWDVKMDISQANVISFNVKGTSGQNIFWTVQVRYVEHAYQPPA